MLPSSFTTTTLATIFYKSHENFICYKVFFYYKYYMHLKMFPTLLIDHDGWFDEPETDLNRKPVALSDDGWADGTDRLASKRLSGGHAPGDLVLYRCEGALVPAALIEPMAEGFWLARDSRHGGKSFHLAARDIATRTRHRDFPLGKAA